MPRDGRPGQSDRIRRDQPGSVSLGVGSPCAAREGRRAGAARRAARRRPRGPGRSPAAARGARGGEVRAARGPRRRRRQRRAGAADARRGVRGAAGVRRAAPAAASRPRPSRPAPGPAGARAAGGVRPGGRGHREQLAGAESIPAQLHLTSGMERVFLDRCRRLPEPVQTLLLVAAADDSGQVAAVCRAAALMDVPADALRLRRSFAGFIGSLQASGRRGHRVARRGASTSIASSGERRRGPQRSQADEARAGAVAEPEPDGRLAAPVPSPSVVAIRREHVLGRVKVSPTLTRTSRSTSYGPRLAS